MKHLSTDYDQIPQGFILNDAGMYSFVCQDVYPDILSFMTAIPTHLKPLFIIPIRVDVPAAHYASDGMIHIASLLSRSIIADDAMDGSTSDGDLFGAKTFVYDDLTPTVSPSDPGSIFDVDSADERTHTQDLVDNQDENLQPAAETSYMSDVDLTDSYIRYPYRTDERPLRHSSEISIIVPMNVHIAIKPHELETRTPESIKDNASTCDVTLVSYDKRSRIFTFTASCGGSNHSVKAKLNDLNHIALNCSCPFWRWNGPEYNARQNDYLLGQPSGKASPPNVRDPEREFHLCKHAYAVVARMDEFVDEVSEENWGMDDEQILEEIDQSWDRMEGTAEIDLDETQKDDIDAEIEPMPQDAEIEEDSEDPENKDSESDEEIYDLDEETEKIDEDEDEDEDFSLDEDELKDVSDAIPDEESESDGKSDTKAEKLEEKDEDEIAEDVSEDNKESDD